MSVVWRMHGPTVRDDGSNGRAAPLFVAHDTVECAARRFVRLRSDIRYARLRWARGSVGRGARLGRDVSTVQGRDARIGCTRAKLYGHD